MSEFRILGLQVILFYKEQIIEELDKLSVEFNTILEKEFSTKINTRRLSPTFDNIPEEFEFPMLELIEKQSKTGFIFGVRKININFQYVDKKYSGLNNIEEYPIDKVIEKIHEYLGELDKILGENKITRIGVVIKSFLHNDEYKGPLNIIDSEKLSRKGITEFSIRINTPTTISDIQSNSVISVNRDTILNTGESGGILQHDINTTNERSTSIDNQKIEDYISAAFKHFKKNDFEIFS